jgi:hypothetical protein
MTAMWWAAPAARAGTVTECTIDKFCYCVDADLKPAIDKEVALVRSLIAAQRKQNKAIGYLSIPLSSGEGSYFPLNVKIAATVKEAVENRFGPKDVWMLNPAAPDIGLPDHASGADYMLLWTRVLEGDAGEGADFDFVYFTGRRDFAGYFGLHGHGDLAKLSAYYDGLLKTELNLKSVDRTAFRNYYGLRASVAFSRGSHDEWNIVRAINAKRRTADSGILKQLGVFFDGRDAAPGLFEDQAAAGYAAPCQSLPPAGGQ